MKKVANITNQLTLLVILFTMAFAIQSCEQKQSPKEVTVESEKPEYHLAKIKVVSLFLSDYFFMVKQNIFSYKFKLR